nr:hypothetical protein [Candidatus Sigynarchaeota archaeon]
KKIVRDEDFRKSLIANVLESLKREGIPMDEAELRPVVRLPINITDADLARMACRVAVGKDWVITVCDF